MAATTSSLLSNVSLHVLWFGGLRFARQDSSSVIHQLSSIFFEWGAPKEILTDNDPVFCSQHVKQFSMEWRSGCGCDVHMYHRATASQREVIATLRKLRPGKRAPFQRPKDGESPATTPANAIYRHRVREKGIHALQVPDNEEKRGPYAVGDIVWIKYPGSRSTTKFKHGRVTGVVSHHSVNGVLRHIKDLHPFQGPIPSAESETDSENQSAGGGG